MVIENKYEEIKSLGKDTKLYISNGLGTDESNMRFNNLPSITLFRIYKK